MIKSSVTTAVVERPALVSCVGRMHSGSSGTAGFQLQPCSLHPWNQCVGLRHFWCKTARVYHGPGTPWGARGCGGFAMVVGQSLAAWDCPNPSQEQGSQGGTGTAPAPSIGHLSGSRDRLRLGQNIGPCRSASVSKLYICLSRSF